MTPRKRPRARRAKPARASTTRKQSSKGSTARRRSSIDPKLLEALRKRLETLEAGWDEGTPGAHGSRRRTTRERDITALRNLLLGTDGSDDGDEAFDEADAPDWSEDEVEDPDWTREDRNEEGLDIEESRWRRWPPPSSPIPVEGGLVARTRRGAIGETWWSKRFLSAIESVVVGGRLTRGRSYARKGQVIDLEIAPGVVQARVQGSRKTPYRVRLVMPVVDADVWDRVVAAFAAEAGYAARLLAGELPHEAEAVFLREGASLFPGPEGRLATGCTCPDFENPCKHVAACCYLLAEAFDRDPFMVLQWRGRGRDALLEQLRALRRGVDPSPLQDPVSPAEGQPAHASPGAEVPTLEECLAQFWKAGPGLDEVRIRPAEAALPDAVLRNLPRGVLESRGRDVSELLAPAYAAVAKAASRRAVGADPASPRAERSRQGGAPARKPRS